MVYSMPERLSLYSRLLKYQESEDRSNLENYLTEMLCDFLNRLSSDETKDFACQVLFHLSDLCYFSDWIEKLNLESELCWDTQVTVEVDGEMRRPDLICWQRSLPVILIESKIDAGFTEKQLISYDKWLNEKNPEAVLVLLRKNTEAPEGFLTHNACDVCSSSGGYFIPKRNCIHWQQVYDWLKSFIACEHPLKLLAEEFIMFMEEQKMAFNQPSSADFAALQLFANGPAGRMNLVMSEIRNQLKKRYPDLAWLSEEKALGQNQYIIGDGKIESWVILPYKIDYSWFGWGIIFPEQGGINRIAEEMYKVLPRNPYWFFVVMSNNPLVWREIKQRTTEQQGLLVNQAQAPQASDEPVCVAYKSVEEFIGTGKSIGDELLGWLDQHFKTFTELLKPFYSS
jgi:hypothetical protein